MTWLYLVLSLLALVCFVTAIFPTIARKIELIAAGLALVTLVTVISLMDRLT